MSAPVIEVRAGFWRHVDYDILNRLGFNPVSHWRLGETSGTTATDVAGASNGTYTGGYVQGRQSLALGDLNPSVELNGTTGRIAISDVHDFPNRDPFSVFILVKADTLSASMRIVDKSDATSGWSLLYNQVTNTFRFERRSAAGANIDQADGPSSSVVGYIPNMTGRIYAICGVYDGSTLTVYKDAIAGTPVASTRNLPGNALTLTLGSRASGAAAFWDGFLDEAMIFNVALTANQVAIITEITKGLYLNDYISNGSFTIPRGVSKDRRPIATEVRIPLNYQGVDFLTGYASSKIWNRQQGEVPIRITAYHAVSGVNTHYDRWFGFAMRVESELDPNTQSEKHSLSCKDLIGLILERKLNGILLASRSTDSAIQAACDDAFGSSVISNQFLQLDAGTVGGLVHWAGAESAQENIAQVVDCELGGRFFQTKSGKLRFLNRSAFKFTDGFPAKNLASAWVHQIKIEPGQDLVKHRLDVSHNLARAASSGDIWTNPQGAATADSPFISPNGLWQQRISFGSPVSLIAALVAATDYLGNDAVDGTGTNRTTSLTPVISGGGGAAWLRFYSSRNAGVYLTLSKVRGNPWVIQEWGSHYELHPQSGVGVAVHGSFAQREQSISLPFIGLGFTDSPTLHYESWRWQTAFWPLPYVVLTYEWSDDDITEDMLDIELYEMVSFSHTAGELPSYLYDYYRIEGIEETISTGGTVGKTVVRMVPHWAYMSQQGNGGLSWSVDHFLGNASAVALDTDNLSEPWVNLTGAHNRTAQQQAVNAAASPAISYREMFEDDVDLHVRVNQMEYCANGDRYGIAFRIVDANNYWRACVANNAGVMRLYLEKVVAGVVTLVSSPELWFIPEADRAGLLQNPLYETSYGFIRVIAAVDHIRVWYNFRPEPIIDIIDDAHDDATKHGLYSSLNNCGYNYWLGSGI